MNRLHSYLCAGLVTFAGVWTGAVSQQAPAGGQEGVQQTYRNMTPAQRAAATRAFLGLGAEPDRVAAERAVPLYKQNCAFCHGQTARGATGPSLVTSDLVLADDHGEHLAPFLKKGRPERGMPAFSTMPDRQLADIAEFLHLQVEDIANRGAYHMQNIVVGNAAKGKAYMEHHCMSCHTSATFEHFVTKFRSPEQLQRDWIWPLRDANLTAEVRTASGTISGRVVQVSDFRITLLAKSGATQTMDIGPDVNLQINDPLVPHQQLMMTLTNEDMHDVTAYLETLK